MNVFVVIVGLIALVLLAFFFFPRKKNEQGASQAREHKQLPDGADTKLLADDNKKLTGEHARQWLDDFLKKQQS